MRFWQKPSTLVGILHLTSYYNPLFSSLAAFPSNTGSHLAALLLTSSLFICFYMMCPSFDSRLWCRSHELMITCMKCLLPAPAHNLFYQRQPSSGGQKGISLLSLLLHRVAHPLARLSKWVIYPWSPELPPKSCDQCSGRSYVGPDERQRLCQNKVSYRQSTLIWCWRMHHYQKTTPKPWA